MRTMCFILSGYIHYPLPFIVFIYFYGHILIVIRKRRNVMSGNILQSAVSQQVTAAAKVKKCDKNTNIIISFILRLATGPRNQYL